MKWWNFNAPVLSIFADEIAFSSGDALLADVGAATNIELFLDCNGGDSRTAFQIFDALKGRVPRATITGRAVSAAEIIALSGNHISIVRDGSIVIHAPTVSVYGTKARVELAAQVLDELTERCVRTVSERRGIKRKAVEVWYRSGREFVFSAQDALNAGLVDEIVEPLPILKAHSLNVFPPGPSDDGKAAMLIDLLQALGTIRCADPEKLRRELFTWQFHNIQKAA